MTWDLKRKGANATKANNNTEDFSTIEFSFF